MLGPYYSFPLGFGSPHYKYLIDKIESVQRYFTKRLFGLSKLSYCERLISLDLDTLEHRRRIYDLVFMVALCNSLIGRPYIFSCCDFYLFSSPNLSGRRLYVYHTSTHGVALVRI